VCTIAQTTPVAGSSPATLHAKSVCLLVIILCEKVYHTMAAFPKAKHIPGVGISQNSDFPKFDNFPNLGKS
jgi:hypothetical protein